MLQEMSKRLADADGKRDIKEAELNIRVWTTCEGVVRSLKQKQLDILFPNDKVHLGNNGVLNSGKLITDAQARNLGQRMAEMDFSEFHNDRFYRLIESMVHTERFGKYSFKLTKTTALHEKNKNGTLAVLSVERESYYDELGPEAIEYCIDPDKQDTLCKEMGYARGIELFTWEVKELIAKGWIKRVYWHPSIDRSPLVKVFEIQQKCRDIRQLIRDGVKCQDQIAQIFLECDDVLNAAL